MGHENRSIAYGGKHAAFTAHNLHGGQVPCTSIRTIWHEHERQTDWLALVQLHGHR